MDNKNNDKKAEVNNKKSTVKKTNTEKKSTEKSKFLLYKGRPLVRSGNVLYYGHLTDKFVIMIQILSTKVVKDLTVADRVQVQLMSTNPELRMKDRILKKSEKNGLYNAMDIGSIWLERALEDAK